MQRTSKLVLANGPLLRACVIICGPLIALSTMLTGRPSAQDLIAAVVGIPILIYLVRHPVVAAGALLIVVPGQLALFSFLLRLGVPQAILRGLGSLKDVCTLSLLIAAISPASLRRSRLHFTGPTVTYIGISSVYLIYPAITGLPVQTTLMQRLLALRLDTTFLVVLLALSLLSLTYEQRNQLQAIAVGTAVVIAVGGIVESVSPSAFLFFLEHTLQVPRYSQQVLGIAQPSNDLVRTSVDGGVRAGSFLLEPVYCAFLYLPAFAVCIARSLRRATSTGPLCAAVIFAGIVCTGTRSALFVSVILLATVVAVTVRGGGRLPLAAYVSGTISLLVAPLAVSIAQVTRRTSAALSGADTSTAGHGVDLTRALTAATAHPLGQGLATVGSVGQRFTIIGDLISENAYLQVVNELGILALAAFLALLVTYCGRLVRTHLATADQPLRAAALGLLVAMIVGGLFQQVWLDYSVSITCAVVLALPFAALAQSTPRECIHRSTHAREVGVGAG